MTRRGTARSIRESLRASEAERPGRESVARACVHSNTQSAQKWHWCWAPVWTAVDAQSAAALPKLLLFVKRSLAASPAQCPPSSENVSDDPRCHLSSGLAVCRSSHNVRGAPRNSIQGTVVVSLGCQTPWEHSTCARQTPAITDWALQGAAHASTRHENTTECGLTDFLRRLCRAWFSVHASSQVTKGPGTHRLQELFSEQRPRRQVSRKSRSEDPLGVTLAFLSSLKKTMERGRCHKQQPSGRQTKATFTSK